MVGARGGLLLVFAFGLRIWGVDHGLPYAYNSDENAHFVTRAIGLFGHGWDPQYYVNPPAYTYPRILLRAWYGGRVGVSTAFAADPTQIWVLTRVLAAFLGTLAMWLTYLAGSRLVDRRVGLLSAASSRLRSCRSSTPSSRSTTSRRSRRCASLCGAPPGCCASGAGATTSSPGWPRAGLRDEVHRRHRARAAARGDGRAVHGPRRPRGALRGIAIAGAVALVAFLAANPYAVLNWDASSTA